MRVQLALNVKDLDEAVEVYSKLFDVKVNKRKPGYANFAIEQPPASTSAGASRSPTLPKVCESSTIR